jgi:predicted GNAT family acetyltransferase
MTIRTSHTKAELLNFFKKSVGTYMYLIGDLDDRFWNGCKWHSISDAANNIKAVALLFNLFEPPTFIAMSDNNTEDVVSLIHSLAPHVPSKLYAHLSVGLREQTQNLQVEKHHGVYHRMMLAGLPAHYDDKNIRALSIEDLDSMYELYRVAYPGNWFDTTMLVKGHYLGYFDSGKLAGVAGTHILSPEYKVATLGNITTHPDYRGRGIAFKLTSNLCHYLKQHTDFIGLNVKESNTTAIHTYQKVGFKWFCSYEECVVNVTS